MNKSIKAMVGLMVLAGLAGCASPERFVLLPQEDGSKSAIVVRSKAGQEVTLDKPYATAAVSGSRVEQGTTDAASVKQRYQTLEDALPPKPRVYLLYFETGGDTLTPESVAKMDEILNDLKSIPAANLMVIGHTDKVGTDQVNDNISTLRANTVRTQLLTKGGNQLQVEAVGRGKRDPLVPTDDGVAEPRNRRVEIRLR